MSQNSPVHWKEIKLEELTEIQSGAAPSRQCPEFYSGDIPWAKTLNLNENIVTQAQEKITELGFQMLVLPLVKDNEVA